MTPTSKPAASEKLSVREKVAYGFGDFGSCIFWSSFMNNMSYFYTDVYGISQAAVGWIQSVSKIWDAANDPMVGMLADRTRTRWGRYRPFLLWFSLPLCIAAVLMFTTPNFGGLGKLIWAWVMFNVVMTLYTLVNIPYTALLGTISPDVKERGRVSSYKFAFAFGAGILMSYTFLPMTRDLGDGDPQRGWQMAALVASAIALPFFLMCFLGTRERVTAMTQRRTALKQDVADLLRNRPWLVLVALTLAWVFFVAVRLTVMNYYLKYYVMEAGATIQVGLSVFGDYVWDFETLGSRLRTSGDVASVLGVLFGAMFVARVEKKKSFVTWFLISIGFTAMPFWLLPHQVDLLFLAHCGASFTSAPLCVLIWSMYADAAEYSEWKNHRQAAGLVFSASTLMQQLGWGFGPAIVNWTLDGANYVANVAQTPLVLKWILLLFTLIPAAFGVLSIVFALVYPLTDTRVHEMSEELKTRRRNGAPAPA